METPTIDEYEEAANIIRSFINLGQIARSMVVGGLNEIRGENILEGGESGGEKKSSGPKGKVKFAWASNGQYTIDGLKATRIGSGTQVMLSETIFKGPGKYDIQVKLNTSHPGSYCFGVTTASYSEMSNYTCNSYSGRSVCGSGFMGSSDSSGYSDLHYGNNEDLTLTLDFSSNTISMVKKGTTSPKYSTSFSSLNPGEGLKLGFSSGSNGEFAEVLEIKHSK
eukprot:TRINITY_DN184_c0_g1_i1.p1 TRINITY_DN184_c0_g1~~TRINITY_DN184_c0_g1_i1.p1  ORF type:complete len:223 (-),score=75.25 TRINITY_DN184_c0_g1_i1:25-693(-)